MNKTQERLLYSLAAVSIFIVLFKLMQEPTVEEKLAACDKDIELICKQDPKYQGKVMDCLSDNVRQLQKECAVLVDQYIMTTQKNRGR